jgi:hypothetical protein
VMLVAQEFVVHIAVVFVVDAILCGYWRYYDCCEKKEMFLELGMML